jgi:hypothetical protein
MANLGGTRPEFAALFAPIKASVLSEFVPLQETVELLRLRIRGEPVDYEGESAFSSKKSGTTLALHRYSPSAHHAITQKRL